MTQDIFVTSTQSSFCCSPSSPLFSLPSVVLPSADFLLVISIFLDDGTFRTFWAKEGDNALTVSTLLVAKLAHLKIQDPTQWHIFEIQDREV